MSSYPHFASVLFGGLACLASCVQTEYPVTEWSLSAGEELSFSAVSDWTLDVVRLRIPETGIYEVSLDCERVDLTLYEDDVALRTSQRQRIEIEMRVSAIYELVLDRSDAPGCRGPLQFEQVSAESESDSGSNADVDVAINDVGAADTTEDIRDPDAIVNDTEPDESDCGPPPTVTNGTRTYTTTTSGSSASYNCNSGYGRSGSATLTCSATGSWGVAPTCVDNNECVPAGFVCTAANNVCANTAGSWQCACAAGSTGTTVTGGNATCVPVGGSGTLGAACGADSECPANSWCSTVSGYRRCAPRVFSGAAHQMDFVFVPSAPSGYQQGTLAATNKERPFTATISRNYFVSRTEVTQGQWKAATSGTNGSCFQSATSGNSCTTSNANNNGPVELLDWYSSLAYANWLSVNHGLSACYTLTPSTCADSVSDWATGDTACTGATFVGLTCTGYRLLTESEWERAARGNTTSTYHWGEATDTATVGLYAWFTWNVSASRTQAVGGKQANAFGLYDMSGNVWEWVWDWVYSGSAYVSYPSGSATDYIGPSSGANRGFRGGSCLTDSSFLRSAGRFGEAPSVRSNDVGFRLARTAN